MPSCCCIVDLRGDLDRLAQHRRACVLLSDRHQRDAERVEQPCLRIGIADRAHERHRLTPCHDRLRVARAQHQRLRAVRDQPGALGAVVVGRDQAERVRERLLALVGVAPVGERALQPAVEDRGAARLGILVDELDRLLAAARSSAAAPLVVAGARGRAASSSARSQPASSSASGTWSQSSSARSSSVAGLAVGVDGSTASAARTAAASAAGWSPAAR